LISLTIVYTCGGKNHVESDSANPKLFASSLFPCLKTHFLKNIYQLLFQDGLTSHLCKC